MVSEAIADRYDVVIVGGGSAGCVLASRLSEDASRRILLIEAGKAYPPGKEPRGLSDPGFRTAFNETNYWPGLSHHIDGSGDADPHLHQARVLGGGSTINGMHAQRGLPRDYDGWRDLGIEGWGWDDVLPHFCALENDHDFSGPEHGKDGPIDIVRVPEQRWSPLSHALHDTLIAKGEERFDDLSTYHGDGVGPVPLTTDFKRRSSAAAYLSDKVRARPNLSIFSETRVSRLIFDGIRVIGVEISAPDGTRAIAAGETIVSCGAIHSPALLLRSGIGPAEELSAAGVEVRANRPGVGRNLTNHPMFSMSALVAPSGRARDTLGPPCTVVYRYSSGVTDCPATDMILNLWERLPSPHIHDPLGRRLADFMFLLNQPFSTGAVTLDPAAPSGLPQVRFNLLQDSRDLDRMVDAYHRAVALARTPAIANKLTVALFLKASGTMGGYLTEIGRAHV